MPLRVLILSNSRPARTWRFAEQLLAHVPGVRLCGVVQRSFHLLPAAQQRFASARSPWDIPQTGAFAALQRWGRAVGGALLHFALWCIHGGPSAAGRQAQLSVEGLKNGCRAGKWPFLASDSLSGAELLSFVRSNAPDLIVVLGHLSSVSALKALSTRGLIRICEAEMGSAHGGAARALQMVVELTSGNSESPALLASLALPFQRFDGAAGFKLKSELIADDLLQQAVASAATRGGQPSAHDLQEWLRRIVLPYLGQLPAAADNAAPRTPPSTYCRSWQRLFLESLLLCSPPVLFRNLWRRVRGRYPVLILAHHLISDRGHRLGMSTEHFWRQVRFLKLHYRIVSLSEAAALLDAGRVRVPTVVLTFDDGYADNFVSLRAVAREEDIPVCLFVTTQPVRLQTPFNHDLANGDASALPMTWDQIRFWSRRGAEFGSHTRTHLDCGAGDLAKLEDEILGAKKEIQLRLERPVPFFAFPFGKRENISKEALAVARSAHTHCLSSLGGENLPARRGRPFHLLRKSPYAEPWELELELQSIFDLVGCFKRILTRQAKEPVRLLPNPYSAAERISPAHSAPGRDLAGQQALQEACGESSYRSLV